MKVLALPDEFSLSYLARLRMVPQIERTLVKGKRTAVWPQVAEHTGLTLEQFVAQHTFYYWNRAFNPWGGTDRIKEHTYPLDCATLAPIGSSEVAVFCPECVREDLSFWGHAYWRRSHQLEGLTVCSKHSCGLRQHRNRFQAWKLDPSTLGPGEPVASAVAAGSREQARVGELYFELSHHLLDTGVHFGASFVGDYLVERIGRHGLRPSKVRDVCDAVIRRLPQSANFTGIRSRVDKFGSMGHGSITRRVCGYRTDVGLAMIAVMGVDEGLSSVVESMRNWAPGPRTPPVRHTFESTGVTPTNLVDTLVRNKMVRATAAKELKITRIAMNTLCRQFHPNLSELNEPLLRSRLTQMRVTARTANDGQVSLAA